MARQKEHAVQTGGILIVEDSLEIWNEIVKKMQVGRKAIWPT